MTWDTVTLDENNVGVTGRSGNHTIGSGANRGVVMVVWGGGSGLTVSGIPTFGGAAMTPKALVSPFNSSPIFADLYVYEMVNLTIGVNAWAVNFTGSCFPTIIIASRDELSQATPTDAADVDTTANHVSGSTATADTESGDHVLDIVCTGGGVSAGTATVSGTGQVILAQSVNTGENHFTGVSYIPGAGATATQTWDLSPVGGDLGLYHIQINMNFDAASPPPDVVAGMEVLRTYRPRPFAPGSIR